MVVKLKMAPLNDTPKCRSGEARKCGSVPRLRVPRMRERKARKVESWESGNLETCYAQGLSKVSESEAKKLDALEIFNIFSIISCFNVYFCSKDVIIYETSSILISDNTYKSNVYSLNNV
ncbi:MAG: hypothetical protein WC721_14860 [Victivallaceae bacterium]